jgi:hypothetical protein
MIDFVYGRGFKICAYWEQRAETPEALAARFARTIDSLQSIDPALALWTCVTKQGKKFETVRDHYAQEVANGVIKDDWGNPEPIWGYRFGAVTREQARNRTFDVSVRAGSPYPRPFPNDIMFMTVTTYEIFEPRHCRGLGSRLRQILSRRTFRPSSCRHLFPPDLDPISLPLACVAGDAAVSAGVGGASAKRRAVDVCNHRDF